MFDCWQASRRSVVSWIRQSSRATVKHLLDLCIDVSTGRGLAAVAKKTADAHEGKLAKEAEDGVFRKEWASFKDQASRSRFAEVFVKNSDEPREDDKVSRETNDAAEHNVEIDLGLLAITYRHSNMMALPSPCATNSDVVHILGASSASSHHAMQAVQVENCVNRHWYRVVGRDMDIQYWVTGDPRIDTRNRLLRTSMGRMFDASEVAPSERWIVPILEPVRRTFLCTQPPLGLFMSDAPTPPNATIAYLVGIPLVKGPPKPTHEVIVYRDLKMVQIFLLISVGRRFYRTLVFTSDDRYSLEELQCSNCSRTSHWSPCERFSAGNYQDGVAITTCILLRAAGHQSNLSGDVETYIPPTQLRGLLPRSLLVSHQFFQDEEDNLRGYPAPLPADQVNTPGAREAVQRWEDVYLHVRLQKFAKVPGLKRPGVCAYITRMSRANARLRWLGKEKAEEKEKEEKEEEKDPFKASFFDSDYRLLNLMCAPIGSRLWNLARLLSRVESLSYVLAWTRADRGKANHVDGELEDSATVDLLELPRLNMTFTSKVVTVTDPGTGEARRETRLFSVDHSDLYISNERSELINKMIKGIPHSLLLSNRHGELQLLVPAIHMARPAIATEPFSTDLVYSRTPGFQGVFGATKYFLYPIHVSLSFLFTPSLLSALYLMYLRLYHRDHEEAFRLCSSIATDAPLGTSEQAVLSLIRSCQTTHCDFSAFRLQLLVNLEHPTVRCVDHRILPSLAYNYLEGLNRISMGCRLDHVDELRLLQDELEAILPLCQTNGIMIHSWRNRIACLAGMLNGPWVDGVVSVVVHAPERIKGGVWWNSCYLEPFAEAAMRDVPQKDFTILKQQFESQNVSFGNVFAHLVQSYSLSHVNMSAWKNDPQTQLNSQFLHIYNFFAKGELTSFTRSYSHENFFVGQVLVGAMPEIQVDAPVILTYPLT